MAGWIITNFQYKVGPFFSYKWSYNSYKRPYGWVTVVITYINLLQEVISPFITSRGPPCRKHTLKTIQFFVLFSTWLCNHLRWSFPLVLWGPGIFGIFGIPENERACYFWVPPRISNRPFNIRWTSTSTSTILGLDSKFLTAKLIAKCKETDP